MNKPRIPKELAELIANLIAGEGTFIQLDPNSKLSIDEQIAQAEAEHRKECDGCRAEYELAQKQASDKPVEPTKAEMEAAVIAAKLAQANMKKPYELSKEEFLAERAAKARKPIGYMVFFNGRIVPTSFGTDRGEVEKQLTGFMDHPINQLMTSLIKVEPEIKPVYL